MIVDPDFLDHWKTRQLVAELGGDELAPTYVLRLWSHCQMRKAWVFERFTPASLKSLCRFPGHANKLDASLLASGFVRREGETLIVHQWEVYNASLVASWNNGRKGGRPPTRPRDEPPEQSAGPPHGIPTGSKKPTGLREEKRREEITPVVPTGTSEVVSDLERFGEWWNHYPRKEGKQKAFEAWRKAVQRMVSMGAGSWTKAAAVGHLLDSVKAYAASPRGSRSDPNLIPHPTTWLNGGRYDDDPATWQTPLTAERGWARTEPVEVPYEVH